MIALPFHPSNAYTIHELQANAKDILHQVEEDANKQLERAKVHPDLDQQVSTTARVWVDQGVIAGCAGGTYR